MLRCCSAAQFLMMNLSGVKDNRAVHVLNISGVLLFPLLERRAPRVRAVQ